jgi:hypothetical protein
MTWTKNQTKEVDKAFLALANVHNRKMDEATYISYMRIIQRHPADSVIRALDIAFETSRFFPKPVELLDIIVGNANDRAALAWTNFCTALRRYGAQHSVEFEDTRWSALVDYFGGWDKVHEWKESELPFRRAEFVKIYAGMHEAPPGHRHIGEIEHHNSSRGFTGYVPETVLIPATGEKAGLSLPPPEPVNPLLLIEHDTKYSSRDVIDITSKMFGESDEDTRNRSHGQRSASLALHQAEQDPGAGHADAQDPRYAEAGA